VHVVSGIGAAEEEDLAGELLADHLGEVGRAVAAVEADPTSASVCLNRACSAAGHRQVADDVQAVPAAGRPAVDHRDDDLGHGADEPLHLEDVQPPALGGDASGVDALRGTLVAVGVGGILVAGAPPDPLVAAGAEGPALGGRRVPSRGPGPLPVSRTTPTSGVIRAWSSAR
jgi:hypothetical protein